MLGALLAAGGRGGCGCEASSQLTEARDLIGLFRRAKTINARTLAWGPRFKFRPSAVRESPATAWSPLNNSAWQPINVPMPQQVDVAPEYTVPWPFDGRVGFRERLPYAPDPHKVGRMNAQPQRNFTFTVPQYTTVPWVISLGGQTSA